jgi:hypothetical protein
MIGQRFQREIISRTHPVMNEVFCLIEQRKKMPKLRRQEPSPLPSLMLRDNARLNINSTDNSVNTLITESDIFTELRNRIRTGVPLGQQDAILQRIELLEQAKNDVGSFKVRFSELIGAAADYVTLIQPCLPFLASMLQKLG